MGFLQRFLSIGSKRNKKRRALQAESSAVHNKEDRKQQERDQEAAASRLLRSSSSRFNVVHEVDYTSLPPLPHPINSLNPTPVATPSRAASIQTRGTYTVKVHPRTVHARTEFPNANPPLETPSRSINADTETSTRPRHLPPVTPRDKSRLHTLRQDPSVASLLDMYDKHGQLDNKAFSNTPTDSAKDGRTQVKRSGSTLRQLLGNPDPRNSTTEGDISWAERFLQEDEPEISSPASSNSSFGLETPKDHLSDHAHPANGKPDMAFSIDNDPSADVSDNYPLFSSMEVELSVDSEEHADVLTTIPHDPTTPQRASEVFGFLLDKDKRQQRSHEPEDCERPLPALPITLDADSSAESASATPLCDNSLLHSPSDTAPRSGDHSGSVEAPSSAGSIIHDPPQTATIMNRTPIAVASGVLRDGGRAHEVSMTPSARPVSRIPRGPRGPQISNAVTNKSMDDAEPSSRNVLRSTTNSSVKTLVTTPDASFIPTATRNSQKRTSTYGAMKSFPEDDRPHLVATAKPSRIRPPRYESKENGSSDLDSTIIAAHSSLVKPRLPVTPARSRSIFDPPHGSTPSPASSSELSPVAQQMMADLRKQRSKGRDGGNSRRKNRFTEVITRG
ncbi:hypothetical protein BV25DRAFT_1914682 [Artomyces pyxidatus]|uniref:Uncharacterized protein n=1 Tax=Artomyces pyxidatus TaxID=48021 RepID=A0ACB8T7P3_9AGAM|nr:hypothetical protein BV25DRAFT_1914682 [Artomyces pyxidatus]